MKKLTLLFLAFLLLAGCQAQEVRAGDSDRNPQFRRLRVDASQVIGTIRSFQGVNCGPAPLMSRLADVSVQYKDVGVDIVRLHDFFGPTDIDAKWSNPDRIARSVNASGLKAIFPDWDSDPEKAESYNFGPADRVVKAVVESGAEVYWRIGRSWSADPDPPPDFDKYANIVKHVAMHYNQGWANGFHYKIRYWEFWNEPDLKASWFPGFAQPFWSGTPQQFHTLYEKVARALKNLDPGLKVGACGKAAPLLAGAYREGLIRYCAAHDVPLDFFSWHHYHDRSFDPYDMVRIAAQYRGLLDAAGFRSAEIHVSEWNINLTMNNKGRSVTSMESAAFIGAALIYMQDSELSRSFYYRGDATIGGLFDFDGNYRQKAYVFKAAGAMQTTPGRLAATGGDTIGLAILAGISRDENTVQILIGNYEIPERFRKTPARRGSALASQPNISYRDNKGYRLTVANLPWGEKEFSVTRYRVSRTDNFMVMVESPGKGGTLTIEKPLPAPAVELIVLQRK